MGVLRETAFTLVHIRPACLAAPKVTYEKLDRLRRRALAAEPDWFNRPAVYEEATKAALTARAEAFELLARPVTWHAVPEGERLRRINQAAELCARVEKHDIALELILMVARGAAEPSSNEADLLLDQLHAMEQLLERGLPKPWPATMAQLLATATPQLRVSDEMRSMLAAALGDSQQLFAVGQP